MAKTFVEAREKAREAARETWQLRVDEKVKSTPEDHANAMADAAFDAVLEYLGVGSPDK